MRKVGNIDRDLDGVYFRVKREDKWCNVCFSDLTDSEKTEVMQDKGVTWLKSLCITLGNTIKKIGDELDLVGE